MKTIEVLRPKPIRSEVCVILDRERRSGGEHMMVQGQNGERFLAVKYMGEWGQHDGWFAEWRAPISIVEKQAG
jgi:hypothetical protein